MKKKFSIAMLFRILGILIILYGIISTGLSLINFDVYTYNLLGSTVSMIGSMFVGIVLIIISVVINANKQQNDTSNEIAKKMKEELSEIKESKSPKKCKYCGSVINGNKCVNCGATIDTKKKNNNTKE